MAWIRFVPANSGGGRKKETPSAKVSDGGQLIMNHAATVILGGPAKIIVEFEDRLCQFRILPATPGDKGAYSLSGGGNAQHTASVRAYRRVHPQMVGEYKVSKMAHGILLMKKTDEELEREISY